MWPAHEFADATRLVVVLGEAGESIGRLARKVAEEAARIDTRVRIRNPSAFSSWNAPAFRVEVQDELSRRWKAAMESLAITIPSYETRLAILGDYKTRKRSAVEWKWTESKPVSVSSKSL